MGCVESIEKKILATEERIKQVMDTDQYFVANMQVIAMTHVNNQQHILGDFEYMIADDDTRIKLGKFLWQLRDIDFNLAKELYTRLVPQVEEPKNIPSFVRRLTYDPEQYVNYSVELGKRVQELQEKWKQLYATYKQEEKKTREYLRNERKQKYKDLAEERDAYEKEQKRLAHLIEKKKKLKEDLKKKKAEEVLKAQKATIDLSEAAKQKRLDQEKVEQEKRQKEQEEQKKKEKEEKERVLKLTPLQREDEEQEKQRNVQKAHDLHAEFTRLNIELETPGIKEEEKNQKKKRIDDIKVEYKKVKKDHELTFETDPSLLTKQISDQRQYIQQKYPYGEPLGPPSLYQRVSEDLDDFMYWIKPDQKPPRLDQLESWDSLDDNAKYFRSGLKQISKGRVAVVFLGGGMETLADQPNVPKGFADISLNQDKCLYQIFADRIKAVQRLSYLYRPDKALLRETDSVHVYVMTAPHNDEETRKRFKDNLNFGLWKKNIHFFCQRSLPATDLQGRFLMKEKLNILMTPDGNGGVYEAIERAGLIQEWRNMGIQYVHFMGIDNLLARPVEPILVGMAKGIKGVYQGLDLVSQYVKADQKLETQLNQNPKNQKLNNFGRIAFRNNLPTVVDHQNEQDQIQKFEELFTCNFVARVDLIQTFIDYKEKWLNYHQVKNNFVTYSAPDCLEDVQKLNSPDQDVRQAYLDSQILGYKGYNYEKRIYDSWCLVHPKRFGLFEVPYDEQFAPIRKKEDIEQAVLQMSNLHYKWLTQQSNYQFESQPSFEFYYKNAEQQKNHQEQLDLKNKKGSQKFAKILARSVVQATQEIQNVKEGEKQTQGGEKQAQGGEKQAPQTTQAETKVKQEEKQSTKQQADSTTVKQAPQPAKNDEQVKQAPQPAKNDEQVAEEQDEQDFEERLPRKLIEVDTKWSYNGEGLPRTNKNYTDAKEKEKVNFVLYMKEDIKPALPWGLNVIYRYI